MIQLLSYPIHALLVKSSQEWLEHCHMIGDDIVAELHAPVLVVNDADLGSYTSLVLNVPLNACRVLLLLRDFIVDLFELTSSDQVRFA